MRRILAGLMLAGCVVICGGCAINDAGMGTALRGEIESLCKQMEDAMRADDLEKVASFYADDGILLSPGGDKRGGSRAALVEYWQGFGTGVDWELQVHSVEGDEKLATQRGRSILTYIKNGERRVSTVEFLLIWQRQTDGTLKIAVDAYW